MILMIKIWDVCKTAKDFIYHMPVLDCFQMATWKWPLRDIKFVTKRYVLEQTKALNQPVKTKVASGTYSSLVILNQQQLMKHLVKLVEEKHLQA